MNAMEKKRMMKEAELQLKALKKINIWKLIAIAFSTIGVAVTYAGLAGQSRHIFLGILGIVTILVSMLAALLLNLGLRNGRKNVEKILNIVDKKYEV